MCMDNIDFVRYKDHTGKKCSNKYCVKNFLKSIQSLCILGLLASPVFNTGIDKHENCLQYKYAPLYQQVGVCKVLYGH